LFVKKARQLYQQFISLGGPAWKIAASFSVGSFVGTCPYIGTHTIISLMITPLFRLNFTSLYFATWVVCNPITGPIIIFGEYELGRWLLSWPKAIFSLDHLTFRTFLNLGRDILIPLTFGWVIFGTVFSLLSYPVAKTLILRVRERRERRAKSEAAEESEGRP
jgi:uncharacterized protein (DUF2062 family)